MKARNEKPTPLQHGVTASKDPGRINSFHLVFSGSEGSVNYPAGIVLENCAVEQGIGCTWSDTAVLHIAQINRTSSFFFKGNKKRGMGKKKIC